MKTFAKLLKSRPWIAYIDDERNEGNSIIVTLKTGWDFSDDPGCGVRGCETVREVDLCTKPENVEPAKP